MKAAVTEYECQRPCLCGYSPWVGQVALAIVVQETAQVIEELDCIVEC